MEPKPRTRTTGERLRLLWALGGRRPADETLAWAGLVTNMLLLPGLGTLLLRRPQGVPQAAVALGGVGMSVYWLGSLVLTWAREHAFPWDGGPNFALGLVGSGLFALCWLWSLASSIAILREARDDHRWHDHE